MDGVQVFLGVGTGLPVHLSTISATASYLEGVNR